MIESLLNISLDFSLTIFHFSHSLTLTVSLTPSISSYVIWFNMKNNAVRGVRVVRYYDSDSAGIGQSSVDSVTTRYPSISSFLVSTFD